MNRALQTAHWHVRLILLSFLLPPVLMFLLDIPYLFEGTSFLSLLANIIIGVLNSFWISLVAYGGFFTLLFLWGFILTITIKTLIAKNKKAVSLLRLQNFVVCLFVLISLMIMSALLGIFSMLIKPIVGLEFVLLICLMVLTYKKSKIK